MYAFLVGMFLVAIVGTVWITLWTIQRGERAKANRAAEAERGATEDLGGRGDVGR